ncbi:MAG: TlpA family protein disulfide reductase, partial [Candidatus Acidiferrum sp.]
SHRALGVFPPMCSPIQDAMTPTPHRRWLLRYFFISFLLVSVAFSIAAQESDQQPIIRFVRNPDPAPDFKLKSLDGQPLTLAASRGKVILLNFWATWCGPCRAEIPDLVDLQNKYKDRLQVIGLVIDDDDEAAIKKFAQESGINYPLAIASADIRIQYGGIGALPTSFVLDSQGRVVQKHEGLRNPVLYEAEIRSLLGLPIGNIRVETFEDTGEVFLKHADRASQLPGVDFSKLTPEQRNAALHRFNAETCTCGCQFTLAQCRIYDRGCATSKAATAKIIAAIVAASPTPAAPVAASPDAAPAPSAPQSATEPSPPAAQPTPSPAPPPPVPAPPSSLLAPF